MSSRGSGSIASSLALAAAVSIAVAGVAVVACGGDDDGVAPAPSPDAGVTPASSLCPGGQPVAWPPGPYEITVAGVVPPDLEFAGTTGPVRMKDYFEPCAERSRVLVIRTAGAWCGSCVWSATHTKRILDDPRFAGRLALLDLLVADEDNMPATVAAAARWQAKIDMPGAVAVDTKFTFAPALLARSALPAWVFVDTRTMKILSSTGDRAPEEIQNKVLLEIASVDRAPRPQISVINLWDGTLSEDQRDLLVGMKVGAAPPPDPTNEYADVAAAAALGKQLFSDTGLAPSGVSCATCHDPTKAFGDGAGQSKGVEKVDRNAPSVIASAFSRWQFWDGRADTLWAQALGPPENAKEVGSSRLYIAHQIAARYATEYAAVFGGKHPLPANLGSLPAAGKPGDPAYDALPQADKDAVTRVYVNVGKAIAAFERSLRMKPTALDAYAGGDTNALTAAQKKALQSFFNGGCAQCHWGPNLTNDAFHVLRFPTGSQVGAPDRGRIDVLDKLAASEFAATSRWSDAPAAARPLAFAAEPTMLGAFKTPSLRGVASTGPWGHGGTFTTLLDVAKHYGTRGKDVGDDRTVGVVEPWVPEFDVNAQTAIVPILEVLTGDVEP